MVRGPVEARPRRRLGSGASVRYGSAGRRAVRGGSRISPRLLQGAPHTHGAPPRRDRNRIDSQADQGNRGARRSAKAVTPSASSPEATVSRYQRAASAWPSRPAARAATTSLIARYERADREARTSAKRRTSGSRSSAGTNWSTRPARSAVGASISSPLNSRYFVMAGPTRSVRAFVDDGV